MRSIVPDVIKNLFNTYSNFQHFKANRWNRHRSYILNIVFLNYLVQNFFFFYFAFSSLLGTKGNPLIRKSSHKAIQCGSHKSGKKDRWCLSAE